MILVVGGAGYIGSHVSETLSRTGKKVVVFDNLSKGHREFLKWGKFFKGDLSSVSDLRECFTKYPIKSVIHLGAFIEVGESIERPDLYYRNNFSNTLNLLDVMRDHSVSRIIFSSTAAVYGTPQEIPLTENHPCSPINPYGWSKFFMEQAIQDYHKAFGLNYVILRYFNAAGAHFEEGIGEWHHPETHLIPNILLSSLEKLGKCFYVNGNDYETSDGTCVRDYIHVRDLAEAHRLALEYLEQEQNSQILNLGQGHGFSILQVMDVIEKILGEKINYEVRGRRPGDPAVLVSSNKRAKEILCWNPQYSDLSTIVSSAYQWHKTVQKKYL